MAPKKGQASKKKKALGSNRGFATVSTPSVKKVDADTADDLADSLADDNLAATDDPAATASSSAQGSAAANGLGIGRPAEDSWDDEAIERNELQRLADKIRPGCDKEVSRAAKVHHGATRRERARVDTA